MKKNRSWIIFYITAALCIAGILIYYFFFRKNDFDNSPAGWGQLGDYIGGVIGTIVAMSTVIFLILTLGSQNKTKNDNFFFYLIQLHEKQLLSLNGKVSNSVFQGKEFYRKLLEECRILYHIYDKDENKVEQFLKSNLPIFDSYIATLHEIINYIKSSGEEIGNSHSVNYKKIFLAQLSNDEKIVLGYFVAFKLIANEAETSVFYKENKIHKKINYEDGLNAYNLRPDAISPILNKIDTL